MEKRKIIIVGCANCPYLQVWNDGSGNGFDSISTGSCSHPTFNKELGAPSFTNEVFKGNVAVKATKFADCCPLPVD